MKINICASDLVDEMWEKKVVYSAKRTTPLQDILRAIFIWWSNWWSSKMLPIAHAIPALGNISVGKALIKSTLRLMKSLVRPLSDQLWSSEMVTPPCISISLPSPLHFSLPFFCDPTSRSWSRDFCTHTRRFTANSNVSFQFSTILTFFLINFFKHDRGHS